MLWTSSCLRNKYKIKQPNPGLIVTVTLEPGLLATVTQKSREYFLVANIEKNFLGRMRATGAVEAILYPLSPRIYVLYALSPRTYGMLFLRG
jgi:hypothetical protein